MDIFIEISLIIVIATVVSGVIKYLKQPLIIGYIITGLIVGPYALNVIQSSEQLEVFSQFGIALLLFIVGLNLSPNVIKEVGKVAFITGVGQVIFTVLIGFGFAIAFGFSIVEASYIAVALTLSSTIIILKLISDKGDLEKLYGKISIGFLLVQDVIATIVLILVSATSSGSSPSEILIQTTGKGLFLAILVYVFLKLFLDRISHFFAKSQEFLFLFSLAWGMGMASIFQLFGFSIEIGALIAGVTLSLFPYNFEIAARMRPLRDFFLILFFILLGSQLLIGELGGLLLPAILLSIFVLIGNPIIMMTLMGLLGYNKRTGFLSGLAVAQISEFSLIIVALGNRLGHLSNEIVSLVTIIGLITITGSSYMILYSEKIYPHLARYISIFEKKKHKSSNTDTSYYDAILFGYNRIGYDFLEVFKKINSNFAVVDYDPEIIKTLSNHGINCIYGDASDREFVDELNMDAIKLIVSTIPDYDTNVFLINHIKKKNPKALSMVVSHDVEDTYRLYDVGADYVVMPHFLGGKYASNLLHKYQFDMDKFGYEKEKHLRHLGLRREMGHDHPRIRRKG